MNFNNIMRIFKRVFWSLYLSVTIIVFFTYISVFMVTGPFSEIPTKFNTESDIQNSKVRGYMEGVRKEYELRINESINNDNLTAFFFIIGSIAFLAIIYLNYFIWQFGPWFNVQVRFPAPRVQPPIIPRGNRQVRFPDNRIVLDPLELQLEQYSSEEEV